MSTVEPQDFFWGPPTSKANFCETDYAVSRYIAEFINSLTNVVYIIYGIYGLRQLRRKPRKYATDALRAVPYWGLIAVGLCSFAFHLSLKYHTQMSINSNRRDSIVMAMVLGSLLLILLIFHMSTDELILHSVSFVGTVTAIGIYTIRLINSRTRPGSAARQQIWGVVRFGAAIFNLGYWLWLLDQWACGFLTKAREAISFSGEDLRHPQQLFAWPASWAATSIFAGRGPSKNKAASDRQL
ncbi:ceramidase [Aspergillus saccharolyticus JOP 1030-1]|uniref:APHC-domain-containing protein n=1 Tax=Aspergillus saccharolyticus JOP 1030-1 TaxID=1450539 RepID=A0A318ZAT8_9EURO|nr:aPHC-domain-containing protein [Aspergillus saccharolyticus JOP 1030-1]PYH44466.1 aPHC-domain-containing protein [Aspergillus saccharolyticus JOP 1030-1]